MSQEPNAWRWKLEGCIVFTVKSMYGKLEKLFLLEEIWT